MKYLHWPLTPTEQILVGAMASSTTDTEVLEV